MNSFTSLSASPFFILRPKARLPADAVARQGFAKDRHEWPVAGEEDAVKVAVFVDVLGRDVQADERLAGAGDAGDEADALARVLPGGADHVGEGRGGLTEVDGAGVAPGDLGDGVAAVEPPSPLR